MNGPQIRALIQGYVNIDSTAKQQIGRSFAVYLGLKPGEVGNDDGIDGMGFVDGLKIYFQSKLSKNNLGVDKADEFYANLKFHQVDIGVESEIPEFSETSILVARELNPSQVAKLDGSKVAGSCRGCFGVGFGGGG